MTTIKPVRRAVIPAAGLGTRFLPATKATPKEMLPIVDKPTIQYIVEEAVASGIESIIIITGKSKRAIEDHFDSSVELETELEKKHNCLVYAVTHEYTEFGECYSFLIVTDYKSEWKTLVWSEGNKHSAFAYVWNKDDDWCSEFGSVMVQSSGGGIKRIV